MFLNHIVCPEEGQKKCPKFGSTVKVNSSTTLLFCCIPNYTEKKIIKFLQNIILCVAK